jgi:hypothetical protein
MTKEELVKRYGGHGASMWRSDDHDAIRYLIVEPDEYGYRAIAKVEVPDRDGELWFASHCVYNSEWYVRRERSAEEPILAVTVRELVTGEPCCECTRPVARHDRTA